MARIALQAALWSALFAVVVGGAQAEVVPVAGTKVSLEPPPEFVVASEFPGFQNAELAASIMITELPAPVGDITAGFTKEGLLSRGMTLRSSEEATVGGHPGRLISMTQFANGALFEKWMAAFGNTTATVLVVATYPQTLAAQLRAPMRSSVLSATWNPGAQLDPFDGLSFRIRESEHLKIQNRVQNTLLLAHSGRGSSSTLSEPFAIVGSSYSPVRIDDVELFAKQRIVQTARITDLNEIAGRSLRIAGRPAYEITARAKDLKSGEALSVYQLVVVEGDTYYLIQGMVAENRFPEYLPEFRQLAESLEIR